MKKPAFFSIFLFFLVYVPFVFAAPGAVNNKFGISLLQPTSNDIKKATELVNSQGGDYGYVTLVIQENDRDRGKWQGIFDELRKYHLIPIVRLATKPEGENWRRPSKDNAAGWVSFLDNLNWVIRQQYVVLFNEPNHATEWGGEVDAKGYAEVAQTFAQKLHEKNKDFFVMLSGFDASAPSHPNQYEDEEIFIKKMLQVTSYKLQDDIDGWASHSYPNPGFSGSPWDTGRKSIQGYDWELGLLKSLGVTKTLPVFITETGWTDVKLSRETIATYYKNAFEQVWGPDGRVLAVTPFVFSYQSEPFIGFSWKRAGGEGFQPQYGEVLGISKVRGEVEQIESGVLADQLPHEFVADSSFHFTLKLKNTGQAIWDKDSGYQMSVIGDQPIPFEYFFSDIKDLGPNRETEVSLYLKTNKAEGEHSVKIALMKNNTPIIQTQEWRFTILPLPRPTFKASLFPKVFGNSEQTEIQIYDDNEGLVYKKGGLRLSGGTGTIDEVQNIVLGKKYRVVALIPYYLPRQTYVVFKRGENSVSFKPLLPLDLNRDGKWSLDDVGELFKHPNLLGLFVP